ncbi:GH36-type glycosyl hydrolase domain-containing protein [Streptomyces sp. NPDC059009]|uniref:GH36-type glycosyl hydrolase domain-containing protein n=1 Tax=Streptomyces sp. NPDC059009 TaxID=3346694 RepID=UPI0036D0F193
MKDFMGGSEREMDEGTEGSGDTVGAPKPVSAYGSWTEDHGLPAFRMSPDAPRTAWDRLIDPPTRRRWIHLGNRRIALVADTDGRSGLWDEHEGLRWLTEPEPDGTGVSTLDGTGVALRSDTEPDVLFGPAYTRARTRADGAELERTVLCPEGEDPGVLVRVRVTNHRAESVRWRLGEEWDVRQRQLEYLEVGPREAAPAGEGLVPLAVAAVGPGRDGIPPAVGDHGTLRATVPLDLAPGESRTVWFRCGIAAPPQGADGNDPYTYGDPEATYERSLRALRERLPRAAARRAPEAAVEIPWHAALLSGGACADGLLGGHSLDQGSAYSFRHGFNGAARDPLQHALPLVYTEPDLALSVLRNTCAWASPDGELPYALDPLQQPRTDLFRPSDQNLWALWLAAEYAAAAGDLAAFAAPVGFHPSHGAGEVPLGEHLRRQFRYLVDVVGTGAHGHLRIRNADWNDLVLDETGLSRDVMIERGESVLNSAMAAWVLPVYAGLAERLGDADTAAEARAFGARLRDVVAGEWNGRWFRRGRGPGDETVGEHDLWLEVQPWAILCGAADDARARELLHTVDELCAGGSPLGARLRWPSPDSDRGTIWYAVNQTLVWAAAGVEPELAWAHWRRLTLHAHAAAYPDIWEGTLSGPDAYLPPESGRAGHTWGLPGLGVAMQAWPVANQHAHSQPLLGYLRLLGVAPTATGQLRVRGGGLFESRVLTVRDDGSGRLRGRGPVEVVTGDGRVHRGGPELSWN